MSILRSATLVLLLVCSNANAEQASNWQKYLLDDSVDMLQKENRIRVAIGLKDDISSLKSYIPSLTPAQNKWLDAEKQSIDSLSGKAATTKIYALFSSNEFILQSFNKGLDEILNGISCILEKDVMLSQELVCWAYINYALTDSGTYNDAIIRLNRSGMVEFSTPIKKQFNLTYSDDDPWGGYHLMARHIQQRLVMLLIRNIK